MRINEISKAHQQLSFVGHSILVCICFERVKVSAVDVLFITLGDLLLGLK
jgi:hypothetical protein